MSIKGGITMVRRSVLVFATALLLSASSYVFAASSQSTFSISPPPIASPVFDVKETDMKVGLTYLTMENSDPGTVFEIDGYGINFVGRTAFGSVVALDYAIGVIYMDGNVNMSGTKMDLSGANIPISVNLEVQPYKNDVFNVILFAGPAVNISAMEIEVKGTYTDTIYVDSVMYGPQGGVQLGFGLGDFNLDVFGMATSLRGKQETTSTYGSDTSTTIPAYTTTSFGADLTYMPWGLALSSIMQEAQQGDNNGFETHIYTISWSHKF
jgi:hypothetical protein